MRELKHILKTVTLSELAHCHFLPHATGQRKCYGQLYISRVGDVRTATHPSEPCTVRTGREGRIVSERYNLHDSALPRITTNTSVELITPQVPTSIHLALGGEVSSSPPLCSQTNRGHRRLSTLPCELARGAQWGETGAQSACRPPCLPLPQGGAVSPSPWFSALPGEGWPPNQCLSERKARNVY